jgi:isopenicillin-N epimerase
MKELGLDAVRGWNHALAWEAARFLSDHFRTELATDEAFVGTMAVVELPQAFGQGPDDASRLRDRLLFDHGIELQVHGAHGGVHARVSAQIYNERADIERLAAVLDSLAD